MDVVEAADPPLRWLGVSASAIGDVDYSGADTIRQVAEELARTGVDFAICNLSPEVRRQLDAYGLAESIGIDRIFATEDDLLEAYRAVQATRTGAGSAVGATPVDG